MLSDWDVEVIQKITEQEKGSVEGREQIAIYRQCHRFLRPLFTIIRERELSEEILNYLYEIAHYCLRSDYVKAHDKYLELSIGNSPWPMGVTMVGIHERSGRSKIFSSQIAHILNDETQRKYL